MNTRADLERGLKTKQAMLLKQMKTLKTTHPHYARIVRAYVSATKQLRVLAQERGQQ